MNTSYHVRFFYVSIEAFKKYRGRVSVHNSWELKCWKECSITRIIPRSNCLFSSYDKKQTALKHFAVSDIRMTIQCSVSSWAILFLYSGLFTFQLWSISSWTFIIQGSEIESMSRCSLIKKRKIVIFYERKFVFSFKLLYCAKLKLNHTEF